MKRRKIATLIVGLSLTTLLISCGKNENTAISTNDSNTQEQTQLPSVEVKPVPLENSTSDKNINENVSCEASSHIIEIYEDTNTLVNTADKEATYSEELARFRNQGNEKHYHGPLDHCETLSCKKEYIENGNLITVYEKSISPRSNFEKLSTTYQTVTDTSLIESDSSYSIIENKELLRLPLKVNNKWTQWVTIDNVEYAMDHKITKIEKEDGLRVITVESKIENIPNFQNNTYIETAVYVETLGIRHVEASRCDVGTWYLTRYFY